MSTNSGKHVSGVAIRGENSGAASNRFSQQRKERQEANLCVPGEFSGPTSTEIVPE
jgi:hypothetical protein